MIKNIHSLVMFICMLLTFCFRCFPPYWNQKSIANIHESKKMELNSLNKDIFNKISEQQKDVFSLGSTPDGLTCIDIHQVFKIFSWCCMKIMIYVSIAMIMLEFIALLILFVPYIINFYVFELSIKQFKFIQLLVSNKDYFIKTKKNILFIDDAIYMHKLYTFHPVCIFACIYLALIHSDTHIFIYHDIHLLIQFSNYASTQSKPI